MSPLGCTLLSPPHFPLNSPPSMRASDAAAIRCQAAPSGDAALRAFRAHHVAGRALDANPALMPALAACARLLTTAAEAEQIHALLVKSGVAQSLSGVYASTSLVRFYSRLGRLGEAGKVFDGMPEKTVVSWNVLLDGLVRAGDLDAAWEVFVEMPERNVVSWNTLMAGFARHGWDQEAVELFVEMRVVYGFMPDETTMVGFVSAVRNIGLLRLGRSAHGYVIRREFSLDSALGVALINMYTRCGSMCAAYRCFSSVTSKDVEHWTSVIGGFAAHGHPQMALRLFAEMMQFGVKPNGVTFVSILNACSHGGLVDEGFMYFSLMRSMSIRPSIQHYGCLVDLLGRAGFLEDAFKLASSLPEDLGFVTWSSLLAACQSHGNVDMAEIAARKLADAEPSHGSSYVLLSNTYARAGQWEDLKRTRSRMDEHRVVKKPGLSWIEVDGGVHSFVTADMLHTESEDIYQILEDLKLNLTSAGCEHDKVVSAVDCILCLVGDKNPEHYFVATQDADLRAKLREVPGVPVIYGLKNSLFIEQPSVQQRKFAQLDEEKCIHMDKSEVTKLLTVASEEKASGGANTLAVAEKSKLKRNRAKGPNPLSCKKKKAKPQPSAAQNEGSKADGEEAKKKRVRKRKRRGKDINQTETAS